MCLHQRFLNEIADKVHLRYFCDVTSIGTLSVVAFLVFLLSESLQANSNEPSIGRKPKITHAMESIISISDYVPI